MMNKETKIMGYYTVIPNEVMFDEKLKANAKLLYGQIALLADKEGYCWASNEFFAKKNHTSTRSISDWISNLAEQDYIILEYEHRGKDTERKIFLNTSVKYKQDKK